MTTPTEGMVSAFDPAVGLGTVDLGVTSLPFHCLAIADGSREIAVGTALTVVTTRRFGRREAVTVTPRIS